ncbi:MAG: hypothetical protein JNL32_12525, partial [Candidatus Kapabacteria bacterium]|nr:hypothetical protein [Candidatus Kapabacteria bacterium]
MLQQLLPFYSGLIILLLTFMAVPNSINTQRGEGFEEDLPARAEWERIRLCDPATGRIPSHIRQRELAFAASLPKREQYLKPATLQSNTWSAIGPYNVGGRTRALAIDAGNENIMLAAGVSGGIWRTSNGGTTWAKMSTPDVMHNVTTIAQDKRAGKQNIWYAGTGELWGNSAELNGTGAYKSTDGGVSWNVLASTTNSTKGSWDSPYEFIWRIVVDHTNLNQDVVYMATALGTIFRSSNGGTTWTAVLGNFGNNYGYFTELAISPSGVLYATISQQAPNNGNSVVRGIFRSTNGTQWTKIAPSFMPEKFGRISIGISQSDESQVYFLANSPNTGFRQVNFQGREDWNSLWKYTYTGGDGTSGVWEDRSQNIPGFGGTFGDYDSQGCYNMYIKVKPDNPNVVFIGGTNIFRSTDGFATKNNSVWGGGYKPGSSLPFYEVYDNQHPDQHELLFLPSNPNVMFSGSDGGVAKCTNAVAQTIEWQSLNNGYRTTQFYTCAIPQNQTGSQVVIGGLQDNGTHFTNSLNPTSTWVSPGLGDGSYCAIADNGLYYMSRQNGRLGRFELNPNGTVKRLSRIDPKGVSRDDYLFINPFTLDPANTNRMYMPARTILWRNNDCNLHQWDSWDTVALATAGWDSLPATRSAKIISAVACSKQPANRVYYGTQDGYIYRLNDAHQGNPTPVDITGSAFPRANIECIAINPRNADSLFVVFSNYNTESIFFSGDGGTTWTAVGGNIENNDGPSVRWLEIARVNGKELYFIGTSTGLYSTAFLNGNQTVWVQEGAATIGNTVVAMMDYRESDGFMVVATHGNGMYAGTVTELPPLPGVPSLVLPLSETRGVQTGRRLEWQPVQNAYYYTLQLAFDSLFTQSLRETKTITTISDSVTGLVQGKREYFWRVRGVGAGGAGGFSPVWKFRTASAPPALSLPANTSTG